MKKKLLSVLLTTAMTAALLTGCGGSGSESAPTDGAAQTESASGGEKRLRKRAKTN